MRKLFSRLIASQAVRLLFLSILFAIVVATLWWIQSSAPSAAAQGGERVTGIPITASSSAVVNFAQLAASGARAPAPPPGYAVAPEPLILSEETRRGEYAPPARVPLSPKLPSVASPPPTANFLAMPDIASVPEGSSWIPPDTTGAVGPSRVMVTHNNNYRVLNKTDGAVLSTVSMASFWNPATSGTKFDPKIAYDPYNGRWLLTGVSNSFSAASSILVGISQTSDPSGLWTLYNIDADATDTMWADYPNLGFNKNWVAIAVNMFTNSSGAFSQTRLLAIAYPTLRAGTFTATYFTGLSDSGIHPAVTYSPNEGTLYIPEHWGSSSATYRLHTLTGSQSSPTLTLGPVKTHTVLGAWVQPLNDILPQAPGSLPTETLKINVGDARIRNAVFRGSSIWYAQTVGLPAGAMTHTAAQWVRLNGSGDFVDGGRVEDPTATDSNGGKWYAYPSVAVNGLNDAIVGYTQFASKQYAAAGYSYRYGADTAGTMRDPYIYKAGEGYYQKFYSGTRNRWGDFSNSVVDPSNDVDLWTIQEYAAPQVGHSNNSGYWGTWWAKVSGTHNFIFLPLVFR